MGMQIWMSWTVCDLHPAQCLGCLFGQKEGIFLGEKNVL